MDLSNRLTLTGTQNTNPGSILIDPTAGNIIVNGQQVLTNGNGLTLGQNGSFGIGTQSPAAQLDVEGTGNVILNSGFVGIGGDPTTQNATVSAPSPLLVTQPGAAGMRLMTTQANHNGTTSAEILDFWGPNNEMVGEIAGLNADYPGAGSYQPKQLAFWSAESGGMLFLARNWPTGAGPIVFADGDYATGEVMRITTDHKLSVGGETAPACLASIKGNASVGSDYSETAAPQDGMIVEGNVGIGTSTPQAALDVNGQANFSGPVELQPQGDLSMGNFTTMPPETSDDDATQSAPAGAGHLNGPVLSGSGSALSGTSGQ